MKKYTNLLFIILILCLSLCGCSGNSNNNNGNNNGNNNSNNTQDTKEEWLVSRESVYENDALADYMVSEYDSQGRIIKYSGFTGDDTLVYYYEYSYDQDGNCDSVRNCDSTGALNHTIDYEYDKNNYLTKSTITFSNGNVYSVSEYENNEKGDPVKLSVYYDNSDKPSVITEYEYDGQGTIVKDVTVEQESNYRSINEYEKGEIVKVSRYDGNGNLYDLIEYSYEYNDDGSIKSFIYKSYDEIEKYYYEYDANGNVLSLKEYDQDDNLVLAYIYEYIKK